MNPEENIKIQLLTEKELEQVLELDDICFGGLWSLKGYQREIESPNSCLLIMIRQEEVSQEHQHQVIGMGCFWSIVEEAHITILAIHPDFQNRGLGQLLLDDLLNQAKNQQLKRATLEVSANNLVALNIYEKRGFKQAGRRKKYYQKTGEDALILWKKI